jgi:hypothetical protein
MVGTELKRWKKKIVRPMRKYLSRGERWLRIEEAGFQACEQLSLGERV